MTNKQRKEVVRVCGPKFEDSDIPAVWRQQKPGEGSAEYPLGGMAEPVDIEREKELTK